MAKKQVAVPVDEELIPLDGPDSYQSRNNRSFPSGQATEYLVRMHRRRLVEAGAIVLLRNQWFALPSRLTAEVVAIGQEAAMARVQKIEAREQADVQALRDRRAKREGAVLAGRQS